MSLDIIIQAAKSKGRGNDTMLVHMTPGEVDALQGIAQAHGGSLTTNPDTGLPEAGFLEGILPAVAGGLLAATGVGAPVAAGLVGVGTGLITGSLEKGLMAGLGAFGGAGLGAGLSNVGAQAAGNAATAGLAQAGSSVAVPGLQSAGLGTLGESMATQAMAAPVVQPTMGQAFTSGLSNMGSGIGQLMSAPNAPITATGQSAMDLMGGWGGLAKYGGAALAPALAGAMPQESEPQRPDTGFVQTYDFQRTPRTDRRPGERYFDTSFTPTGRVRADEFQGYARGGDVVPENEVTFTQERLEQPDPSGRRFSQEYGIATLAPTDGATGAQEIPLNPVWSKIADASPFLRIARIAGGPLSGRPAREAFAGGFRGYAQGGMPRHLKGPGDGQSDSIPAMVDGVQPAGLSTDEFVVPADVVSQLGNGSSDAGAKQLYAMMDRIREKAHGTRRQQRPVDPAKVLPV